MFYKMSEKKKKNNDFPVSQIEKDIQFETVYKRVLPTLHNNGGKLIAAQLILSLQLEGQLGKQLKTKDISMLDSIKDQLLHDPALCKEAVTLITILRG